MERLQDVAERVFARHETFHPRYGWFYKAVNAAQKSERGRDMFRVENATIALGVGKNMVKAIRFWGQAAKLLAEDDSSPESGSRRVPSIVSSRNGLMIFDDQIGLDPYLELPGTLWLLHWWMLRPVTRLPVWWIAFQRFGAVEFAKEDLVNFVLAEVDRSGWKCPRISSVRKDVSCLLRMYSARDSIKASFDDLLDCPMRELGLIEASWGEKNRYRFRLGPKPTLPDMVLVYACLDWIACHNVGSSTTTLSVLASAVGSPGRAFRMRETDLFEALTRVERSFAGVKISSAAGAPLLVCRGDPAEEALHALRMYYAGSNGETKGQLSFGDGPVCSVASGKEVFSDEVFFPEETLFGELSDDPLKMLFAMNRALKGKREGL